MSIGEFLKSLAIDTWYKALVYIGGLVLVLSLFVEVKGLSSSQVQLVSAGVFLVGLGEWKNHKFLPMIKPPNAYTGPAMYMNVPVWKPDLIGVVLDLLGLALLVAGARLVVVGV